MIVKRVRKSVRPIFDVSTSSTSIRPCVASTNLKKDRAKVLLPEPVLPRMPTYCGTGEGERKLVQVCRQSHV